MSSKGENKRRKLSERRREREGGITDSATPRKARAGGRVALLPCGGMRLRKVQGALLI